MSSDYHPGGIIPGTVPALLLAAECVVQKRDGVWRCVRSDAVHHRALGDHEHVGYETPEPRDQEQL